MSAPTASLVRSACDEPSVLCSVALPQIPLVPEPDTKQPLSNIYWADCRKPGLLGNCTGKSEQSKCHSHYILRILQSLQMTLTFLCHRASHLLRAASRVLILIRHVLPRPEHDSTQASHYPWAGASLLQRQTAKARRDGSPCAASDNQWGAKCNWTQ